MCWSAFAVIVCAWLPSASSQSEKENRKKDDCHFKIIAIELLQSFFQAHEDFCTLDSFTLDQTESKEIL